jgi:uncharacterized protein YoxC
MNLYLGLQITLTVVAVILAVFISIVLIQLSRALSNFNKLITSIRQDVLPGLTQLANRANKIGDEFDKLTQVVSSVKEVGEKVQATTETAREILSSPAIKAAGLISGVRAGLTSLIKRRK